MRTLKIYLATEDGEVLDSATLEVEDTDRAVVYRPSQTVIAKSGYDDVLVIPEKLP